MPTKTKKISEKIIIKMYKLIFKLIIISIFFFSCQERPQYIKGKSFMYRYGAEDKEEIRYFKDERTNICYAERGLGENYTFTCVPCDSIKFF